MRFGTVLADGGYGTAAEFRAGLTACGRTTCRMGTKGPLRVAFAAVRVRVADGQLMAKAQQLPGEAAWLVCERRTTGERK